MRALHIPRRGDPRAGPPIAGQATMPGRAAPPGVATMRRVWAGRLARGRHAARSTVAGTRRVGAWLSIAVLAATSVTAARIWAQPSTPASAAMTGLQLARDRGATGRAEITGIETALLWSRAAQADAVVLVRDTTSSPVEAQVWWIVGHIGDAHPWTDPVLLSPSKTVTLSPHQTTSITIAASGLPRDGTYTLSAWVHTLDGSEFVPSDGVALAASLTVDSASTTLTHEGPSDPTLDIVSATTRRGSSGLVVVATVANAAALAHTVRVTATMGRATTSADMVVDEASSRVVTLSFPASKPIAAITLTLATVKPDGTTLAADQVALASPAG